MKKPRVGLLPLYLELYDIKRPERRPRIEGFYEQIAAALTDRGLEVSTVQVCRLKAEFNAAIRKFEDDAVDAIVTLHLAYSPSLESSEALASTSLPLVVLDTTPAYSYGPGQDPAEVSYNHGIHGVQDMCNLLIRNGKPFPTSWSAWQVSRGRRDWRPVWGERAWADSDRRLWGWGILLCPRQPCKLRWECKPSRVTRRSSSL